MRYLFLSALSAALVGAAAGAAWRFVRPPAAMPGACVGEIVALTDDGSARRLGVDWYMLSLADRSLVYQMRDGAGATLATRRIELDRVALAGGPAAHFVATAAVGRLHASGVPPASDPLFLGLKAGDRLTMRFTRHRAGVFELCVNGITLGYCVMR